jgi:hypothetical protein
MDRHKAKEAAHWAMDCAGITAGLGGDAEECAKLINEHYRWLKARALQQIDDESIRRAAYHVQIKGVWLIVERVTPAA